ncbi:UNVERIFIED_CONTAM: hypothetical protein FKN15_026388 [Acipenser sinensis]
MFQTVGDSGTGYGGAQGWQGFLSQLYQNANLCFGSFNQDMPVVLNCMVLVMAL